ncbi:hypothetical protein CH330_03865 [candidate division WOR-3 bacterium JGI_Cruoil_03_51_56]|uniref:Uncharacterized protein n=1 Tax=candidate division WOR-3 bacterium JGI_Cruoil_03_51_56 TaxID=1973747 RepID=A0A235BUX0_UNCW3|nr:MAG: hypothetical protein CH330_03865 [candidate division WOR-3 bacterium JGI_Cruoil_03_51_56]
MQKRIHSRDNIRDRIPNTIWEQIRKRTRKGGGGGGMPKRCDLSRRPKKKNVTLCKATSYILGYVFVHFWL